MRVTFDDQDDEPPIDDAWQPSLFGGPGAESILRQSPLFPGGLDRGKAPSSPAKDDQPALFPDPEPPEEEPCGSWFEPEIPPQHSRATMRKVARSPFE